jgi:hypothetical protein
VPSLDLGFKRYQQTGGVRFTSGEEIGELGYTKQKTCSQVVPASNLGAFVETITFSVLTQVKTKSLV